MGGRGFNTPKAPEKGTCLRYSVKTSVAGTKGLRKRKEGDDTVQLAGHKTV